MSYGNILDSFILGIGRELDRIEERMYDLLNERRPLRTTELLEEYEYEFGLPEPGTSLPTTDADRQTQIASKILIVGRTDKKYFAELASDLGYKIVIGEYTPSWCGVMQCGDAVQTQKMIHYWVVGILPNTSIDLIEALKTSLDIHKPAHTIILYSYYGGEFSTAFGDGFLHTEAGGTDYWGGAFSLAFNNSYDVNLDTILPEDVYNGGQFDWAFGTSFYGFEHIITN